MSERNLVLLQAFGRGKTSGLDVSSLGDRGAALFEMRGGEVVRHVAYWSRDRAFPRALDLRGLGSLSRKTQSAQAALQAKDHPPLALACEGMTNEHDNAQDERPASEEPSPLEEAERETERLAEREEPMTPGQKQATEAARKGLRGWRRWLRTGRDRDEAEGIGK